MFQPSDFSALLSPRSPKTELSPKLCISKADKEEPSAAKRARTDMRLELKLYSFPVLPLPFLGRGFTRFASGLQGLGITVSIGFKAGVGLQVRVFEVESSYSGKLQCL